MTEEDRKYEQWKREHGLDDRGHNNFPVLPSESKAAFLANESAKKAFAERED